MRSHELWRWCAVWARLLLGPACRSRGSSQPCAPTRSREVANCDLYLRLGSAMPALTTMCRLRPSSAFCTLLRTWLLVPGSAVADATAPAKGTRPEGAESEADASRKVREMFTQIASRYDFLNHLLSFQLDRFWRARVARRLQPILQRSDALVLDLCCGTGDLAIALARSG